MTEIKIAPSILSANFINLGHQIKVVEKGGADWIHLDIMDGHFVPNITFGPMVVNAIRSITELPLDAHLMIENPERFLYDFQKAGTDRLTVHVETCVHLRQTIRRIKKLGMKAGVSLNPATHVSTLKGILPLVDQVLVMAVNPGFGGQKFIQSTLQKVKMISALVAETDKRIEIEVDGGINEDNAEALVEVGATVLVAGNSIFSKKNISLAIKSLRKAAK